jgi:cytochrome c553
MVKTIVTPENNSIQLIIPANYIGREIEILVYAKDELEESQKSKANVMEKFAGVLNDQEYQALKAHTEQARKEWGRDI